MAIAIQNGITINQNVSHSNIPGSGDPGDASVKRDTAWTIVLENKQQHTTIIKMRFTACQLLSFYFDDVSAAVTVPQNRFFDMCSGKKTSFQLRFFMRR
ncbi:MAG TPA: hypothetical protein DDZ90_14860 [Planctomycetaceae bacterium]|nr:hypothetical protein [Gimesia sp.]HBL44665.1 hypothetical protein [Planctomycetaceae bacterium]